MNNNIDCNMQNVHLQGVGPHLKALLFIILAERNGVGTDHNADCAWDVDASDLN